MEKHDSGSWDDSKGLALAILKDRRERRKWLAWMLMVPVAMLALGLWVLDEWIWSSLWLVLFWWGGCAIATCIAMLFAVYDALSVVKEEREAVRKSLKDDPF